MERYFITVEWCNNGIRGIFCDGTGGTFSKETEHTEEEIQNYVGPFSLILSPKSEPFTEEELKKYNKWRPLAEYKQYFGIAFIQKREEP